MGKRLIVVELVGGVGNQMFVYSTAKEIELKLRQSVKYDSAYYSWWPRRKTFARELDLDKFEMNLDIATEEETRKLIWRTNNRYINTILKRYGYFSKKFRKANNISGKEMGNLYISGFKADFDFVQKNIEMFRRDFRLKEKYQKNIRKELEEIRNCDSVSINVRRGDLTEFKDGNVTPMSYYKKAIGKIEKTVENPRYFVFSDDIEWCKKNMKFVKNATFIEGHGACEDLELMKNCKHNILANSTLSLWAGLLNKNKEKIVVVPGEFHHRERHKANKLMDFPAGWTVL